MQVSACIRIPHHTVTPTNKEPEQYNTLSKSTISRKLLKMNVLTFETCWAVNSEIIKQVTSSWSIFIQAWTYLQLCCNLTLTCSHVHRTNETWKTVRCCWYKFDTIRVTGWLWGTTPFLKSVFSCCNEPQFLQHFRGTNIYAKNWIQLENKIKLYNSVTCWHKIIPLSYEATLWSSYKAHRVTDNVCNFCAGMVQSRDPGFFFPLHLLRNSYYICLIQPI